jgi:Flp pilus assembly protein TadD
MLSLVAPLQRAASLRCFLPRAYAICIAVALALLAVGCPDKKEQPAKKSETAGKKPAPPTVPESGPLAQKIHYEQAKSLLRAGKPREAVKVFRRAVEADENGKLVANCYLGMGSAFGDLGKHAKAVEAFEKVVELQPSNPEAYRALAIGLEDDGRLPEARRALEQALALDGDQLSAYQDLAALYLKARDMEGAKKTYLRYELTRTRLIRSLGLAKDEKRREHAAHALADARDEATAKALGLALTDKSRRVRLAVIRALGQQRLSEGVGPLKALLERTKDPEERRLIQLSLQAIASAPQPKPQPQPSPRAPAQTPDASAPAPGKAKKMPTERKSGARKEGAEPRRAPSASPHGAERRRGVGPAGRKPGEKKP